MMLRAKFWERASVPNKDIYGTCMAAATGLRALAAIPASAVDGMRVEDALPQGRESVVVTSHGQTEELPVIPALAALLKRWKHLRVSFVPADGSDKLFADRNGRIRVNGRLNRAGAAMGAAKPLWQMLSMYFEDTLDKHPDEFAIEAYEARCLGRGGDPTAATRAAIKKLVLSTDRFAGATDFVDDDALALDLARTCGTALPASRNDLTPELRQHTASDHPFIVEITNKDWPPDKCTKAAAREDLYIRHMSEIDRMSKDGSLTSGRAAMLFGMRRRSFLRMVARARKRAGHHPRGTRAPTGPIVRPALTAHEAERLKYISEKVWPSELLEPEFRQALIAKQAQFILGLVEAGKISVIAGAALFRMDKKKFGRMRADLANGTFDHWLDPTPISVEERMRSEKIVLREMSGCPKGQTLEQYYRGIRKKFGLRLPMHTILFIIKKANKPMRERKPTREVRPSPSIEETKRLYEIASLTKPAKPDAGASFRRLLAEHGEFVFDLIQRRVLALEAAARLFGIGKDRISQIAALYRDGDLNLAIAPPVAPSEYVSRRRSVVRELRRRPPDQSLAEFCRVLTRKLQIFVTPAAVRHIIATEKEARLPPSGGKAFSPVGKKAPLRAADRQRLKMIASAPWTTAHDIAELRRQILAEHGSFIMKLLDANRLHNRDAAKLLRLGRAEMTVFRSDYRNGIFEHHLLPPAPKSERRTWHRRVAAAYRDRPAGGTDANFIRDFRRRYRPPLSHNDFKRVIAGLR